ncbi:MAG: VWA domain-containing protein [Acidobacteriota bacterium]|nr:VWA domain-containing protein [Acidobacteriota bacterium]
MSPFGLTLLILLAQNHLHFVKPKDDVFAGEVRVVLKTDIPAEDIIGLEIFAGEESLHYFEEPPFDIRLDLSRLPEGPVTLIAVLETFDGKRHTARVQGTLAVPNLEEDVYMVRVPVLALGSVRSGELQKEHFQVSENEIQREVALLFGEEKPLDLLVLLDLSGSMHRRMGPVQGGMKTLMDMLRPNDSIQVIGFNHLVYQISPRSTDMAKVRRKLAHVEATGGTNLYGAVWSGLKTLGKSNQRRAIVLFTDGDHDLESERDRYGKTLTDCIDLARENGVPVYSVGIGSTVKPDVLNQLAAATGGKAFIQESTRRLHEAFAAIGEQLRHQYLVCYYTESRLSGWHRIEVSLPDKPGVELHYPKQLYFKF